jgi:hypothetical protein
MDGYQGFHKDAQYSTTGCKIVTDILKMEACYAFETLVATREIEGSRTFEVRNPYRDHCHVTIDK